MRLIAPLIRFFFHHFYHTFAWTYDFVAATVSIGRWNDWIQAVTPFIQGRRVLEIGHGPGHLQLTLREARRFVVGLDESRQMGRLAKKRLKASGYASLNLTRGLAQRLPFPAQAFDTVVSTFPAAYLFDVHTISAVYRVLQDGGRFIVLPAAWIIGRRIVDRLARWLFQVTGETPKNILDIVAVRAVRPLEEQGFQVETRQIEVGASIVLIITAGK